MKEKAKEMEKKNPSTKAWSPKKKRQYEHIKESYEDRGQPGRAKEIAARTVNKQRAREGDTES